jgi:hypothetical protein
MQDGRASALSWAGHESRISTTYEDERENFDPAGVRPFVPEDIAELADGKRLRNCARRWEYIWQIVETVGDRRVLHDVAFVQNVGPRRGDRHVERIGVPRRELCPQ